MAARRIVFACMLACVLRAAGARAAEAADSARTFSDYLSRQEAYGFSGAVLIARGDSVLWKSGYGFADRKRRVRFDEHTRINLASQTKSFTATIVLALAEEGRLSTADSLGALLAGVPADKRGITVHQLLAHSSGLPWDTTKRGQNLTRDQVLSGILAARLRSRPGEKFSYSNAGYELLAVIAETAGGRSYAQLLRDKIIQPAQLDRTGVVGDDAAPDRNVARGYNEWRDLGTWREWNDGWRHGSGDVISTLDDEWTWFSALRAGKLIAPAATRRMFTTQVQSADEGYGYGWFTSRSAAGDSLIAHGGDNRGYHTELRWYPDRALVIIVLTNLELYDESGSGLGLHKRIIASALERIDRGQAVAVPPAPYRTNPKHVAPPLEDTSVERDGATLRICADGQDAINALLGLDDERIPAANQKSRALLDAVAARDSALVRRTLGDDAGFFLGYAFGERAEMETRLGAFKSARVCGTRPMPWDPQLLRTFALLTFERATVDYQYTWRDGAYYESISETGAPHALMLPLVPVDELAFVAWDLVGRRGARLEYAREDGVVRLRGVVPLDLSPPR